MSGSEIVEGWEGKRIMVSLASEGYLEGELVRSDAAGVLFAVEKMGHSGPEFEQAEDSSPMFCFVPWVQIKMLAPRAEELP